MSLTTDRNTPMKDGILIVVPVASGVKIFAGSLIAANNSGYAVPGSTDLNLTYLGRADEYVDNTTGGNGAKTVQIRRMKAFKFKNHTADLITQESMGKLCFIVDDETVAKTNGAGARSAAGTVLGIEADGVWIQ